MLSKTNLPPFCIETCIPETFERCKMQNECGLELKSISVINFVKNFKVATDYWSSYNCYGLTKLQRDRLIMAGNRASVIFRQVSWGNPKIWFREVDLLQLSCFPVVRVNCLHLFPFVQFFTSIFKRTLKRSSCSFFSLCFKNFQETYAAVDINKY